MSDCKCENCGCISTQTSNLRLSDNVIAHIAKLLQVAILTGTDIVDNLRSVRLELDGTALCLVGSYESIFNDNINKMINEVQDNQDSIELEDIGDSQ